MGGDWYIPGRGLPQEACIRQEFLAQALSPAHIQRNTQLVCCSREILVFEPASGLSADRKVEKLVICIIAQYLHCLLSRQSPGMSAQGKCSAHSFPPLRIIQCSAAQGLIGCIAAARDGLPQCRHVVQLAQEVRHVC